MGDAIVCVSRCLILFWCVGDLWLPVDSWLSAWVLLFPLCFQLCFHGPVLFWVVLDVCCSGCCLLFISDCCVLVASCFSLLVSDLLVSVGCLWLPVDS